MAQLSLQTDFIHLAMYTQDVSTSSYGMTTHFFLIKDIIIYAYCYLFIH